MSIQALASVSLPRGMEPSDVTGVIEQLSQQALFVTTPRGSASKSKQSGKGKTAVVAKGESVPFLESLPATIERPLRRMESLAAALVGAMKKRQDAGMVSVSELDTEKADEESDMVWRGFALWLEGYTMLEGTTGIDVNKVRGVYARLFPADPGMRFIRFRPSKQWKAMSDRMVLLSEPEIRSVIELLHGQAWLLRLATTHENYGRAYGFTQAQTKLPSASGDAVHDAFFAAMNGLREYVGKVALSADPEISGSTELAEYLLQPFMLLQNDFARRDAGKKKPAKAEEPPKP